MTSLLDAPISTLIDDIAENELNAQTAIAACQVRFAESAPAFRAVLERAARGEQLSPREENLFFIGVHALGGGRDKASWPFLCDLLRLPEARLHDLLGDAVTETLPKIVIGAFDGDAATLFELIESPDVYEFVKCGLFGALAFLTWKGEIDRERTIRFLERYDDDRLDGGVEGFLWSHWAETATLLGVPGCLDRIEAMRRDGRLMRMHDWPEGWPRYMREAETAYENGARFKDARLGYIEDVLDALSWVARPAEETDDSFAGDWPATTALAFPRDPYINEWRDVGRNDPCPCGSGLKAKKCCLRTAC